MNGPTYTNRPIQTVESLCRALGEPEGLLRSMAERIPKLYIGPKPKPKKNGNGFRYVYDTKPPLKPLLKKINRVFFENVDFPLYLQGSLKGRDFMSNADVHKNSRIVISEDIVKFFDHITAEHVYGIWHDFFGFENEPAALLTALTTREGRVFQGTPTSSYLANLAFWTSEGRVVERLAARGIRYSRYVDDVTISHPTGTTAEDKTWVIAQIYAMIGARGFKPERTKHAVQTAQRQISVMGLNVNRCPTLSAAERSEIRAMVHRLEERMNCGETGPEFRQAIEKASGKIGRMSRFHQAEAVALRRRVQVVRRALTSLPFTTGSLAIVDAVPRCDQDTPPF